MSALHSALTLRDTAIIPLLLAAPVIIFLWSSFGTSTRLRQAERRERAARIKGLAVIRALSILTSSWPGARGKTAMPMPTRAQYSPPSSPWSRSGA
jgi:hypothetical protein